MPRKRTRTPENYHKAFPTRLRDLLKERGRTQEDLAAYIREKKNLEKFSRQSVAHYYDGSSSPDWETLNVIADFFGVSVGYLTGHEDYRTLDPNIRMICDYTGLSEQTITNFNKVSTTPAGERIKLQGIDQFFGRSVQVVRILNKNIRNAINAPNANNAYEFNGVLRQAIFEIENGENSGEKLLDLLRDHGAEIVMPSDVAGFWKDRTRDAVVSIIDSIRKEKEDREARIDYLYVGEEED